MEVQRTPPANSSQRVFFRNKWFVVFSVAGVILVLASYSNFFHQPFHVGDSQVIEDFLYVQGLESIPQLFTEPREVLTHLDSVAYRPVLSLSFSFDHWLAGSLDPRPFHFTQFILIVLLGLSVGAFCQFILDRAFLHWSNKYIALVAGLWCCVHFANAEMFIEISSRASLLATLGVVGSFLLYGGLPVWRPSQVYLLPMMIGTLAHPLGVLFAPLLLVYGLLFEKRLSCREMFSAKAWPKVRHALGKTLPAFFTGMGLLLFLDSVAPLQKIDGGLGVETILIQPALWLDYLYRFIIPVGVNHDMVGYASKSIGALRFLAGLTCMGLLVRLMWVSSRKKELRPVAFGIMWFILGMYSVGNLENRMSAPELLFPFMGLMLALMAGMAYHLRNWRRCYPQRFSLMIPVVLLSGVLVLCIHAIGTYQLHAHGFSHVSSPEMRGEENQIFSQQELGNG